MTTLSPARIAVALLLCGLAAGGLQAQDRSGDWLQFRGPGGLGTSAARGIPATWSQRENLVWKTALPGAGTSSPIIAGARIYLTAYSGFGIPGQGGSMEQLKLHLLCLDRATGRQLWSRDIAPKLPEQQSIREGHGYASGTPAVVGDRIYAFFGKSGVVAFDLEGNRLWRTDVGSGIHGWGSATSPVVFGDLVIVNASVESQSLVALNRQTGKEVWRVGGVTESWNTPLLVPVPGGKTELAIAVMRSIWGIDPATGQKLWTCGTGIEWYIVPSMVHQAGVIWCLGGRSGIAGLAVRAGGRGDVTNSHRLWTSRKGSNVPSPIIHEGRLYWMHNDLGIAYCADGRSGNMIYEERIDRAGQVYASPVMADGKIIYLNRQGRAFVVANGPRFQLLSTNDLSDGSMFNSSPSIAGNRLFIRSDRFLYCLGSPRG